MAELIQQRIYDQKATVRVYPITGAGAQLNGKIMAVDKAGIAVLANNAEYFLPWSSIGRIEFVRDPA